MDGHPVVFYPLRDGKVQPENLDLGMAQTSMILCTTQQFRCQKFLDFSYLVSWLEKPLFFLDGEIMEIHLEIDMTAGSSILDSLP